MSNGLPQRADAQRRKRRQPEQPEFSEEANHTSSRADAVDELVREPSPEPLRLVQHRSAAEEGQKFEYLDHPADVQLHSWGTTLEEAFAGAGLAMYNYMTPLSGVTVDTKLTRTFHAEAHDLHSLLFSFLDELLFVFSTDLLVCRFLEVTELDRNGWTITAKGQGEKFDRQRHAIGTEVKAITYSAMQIREEAHDAEIFVIVDI